MVIARRIGCIGLSVAIMASMPSCGGSKPSETLTIPKWISERAVAQDRIPDESVGVNFYYDNTKSMYPFVCDKNESSENTKGKASVSGTLVEWMSATRQILQQNKGVCYTLQDKNGTFVWDEFSGDIHDSFGTKNFYTTGDAELPKVNRATIGPLSQLYYNHQLDIADVNIVLTDLAEQGVNNTELAALINKEILSQDGYAAAVIAAKCEFNGTAYAPNPDKISELLKAKVYGERPLYMILTGPDKQLSAIYDAFISAMNQQGMKEGINYHTYYQSSDSNVSHISDSEIVVGSFFQESNKSSFKKYFETSDFFDTLGLTEWDKTVLPDKFGSSDYLNMDIHGFDYTKSKRTILNYYLPLHDVDEFGDSYHYRVATSMADEQDTESINSLLTQKDYITYSYATMVSADEVESSAIEEPSEVEEENTGKEKEETRDSSRRSGTRAENEKRESKRGEKSKSRDKVCIWENGSKLDFDKNFELTITPIDFESGDNHILAGANVVDRPDYVLSAEDDVDLSAADHWLQLTIEGKGEYPSTDIAFDIPVYAYVSTSNEMPEWVSDWNITAGISNPAEVYMTHTFNLTGFYSTLFGVDIQHDEGLYQAQREVKVADVVTVISGLPVSKTAR